MLSSTSSNCKYSPQSEKGVTFNNLRDYLVFRTRSVAVDFLVSFYLLNNPNSSVIIGLQAFFIEIFSEEGKRIGSCYALPSTLQVFLFISSLSILFYLRILLVKRVFHSSIVRVVQLVKLRVSSYLIYQTYA